MFNTAHRNISETSLRQQHALLKIKIFYYKTNISEELISFVLLSVRQFITRNFHYVKYNWMWLDYTDQFSLCTVFQRKYFTSATYLFVFVIWFWSDNGYNTEQHTEQRERGTVQHIAKGFRVNYVVLLLLPCLELTHFTLLYLFRFAMLWCVTVPLPVFLPLSLSSLPFSPLTTSLSLLLAISQIRSDQIILRTYFSTYPMPSLESAFLTNWSRSGFNKRVVHPDSLQSDVARRNNFRVKWCNIMLRKRMQCYVV